MTPIERLEDAQRYLDAAQEALKDLERAPLSEPELWIAVASHNLIALDCKLADLRKALEGK